ncbi:MAG: glutathione S-transferase family protein [Candidatus Eremiobacteraeota bacterium]|nr:glutathione S-transferase family protein [Candidatus Eremiobacteraeota bacterium]MCW5866525.1 glutathione S-transferase family protein [Candidatus Eremiobacteraeota bacterium]
MKLFYAPQTRAVSSRWALEEVAAAHELIRLKFPDDLNNSELQKANPLGQIPTLVDGDQVVTEASAIALYLADRFPRAGLAPTAEERHQYYQWAFFVGAALEPHLLEIFLHTVRLPEEERSAERATRAKEGFDRALGIADDHLASRSYLLGERFSMVDVIFGSILGWAQMMNLLEGFEHVRAYFKRVCTRPAFERAVA